MANPEETHPNVKQLKDFFTQKIRDAGSEGSEKAQSLRKVKSLPRSMYSAQAAVERTKEGFLPSFEEDLSDISRINLIFDDFQNFLRSGELELRIPEFFESFPHFTEELKKRQQDLNRKDLCIIIAGETSAGKSTLINRLVGTGLFKPQVTESTSTICRIRNSYEPTRKISFKVVNKNGETKEERSIDAEEDGNMNCLQRYVDKKGDLVSKDIDHVDISLHVPFLKGNTMIVDTPGIGGSLELSEKMMKYLPNAVSFIFVSNVTNAGGVQSDRLVKIIQEVLRLHEEKDIPCFDPTDALFVSNKWDAIPPNQRDDAWKSVQKELRKHWPVSNTKNIFKTALQSAKESGAEFENEYKRLVGRLTEIVEKNQYIRQVQHEKFLRNMSKNIELTVKGRLHVASMSKDACTKKMESLQTQLSILKESTIQKKKNLNGLISYTLKELSQALIEELNSEEGKERILNPPGKKELVSVHLLKITDKIKDRLYSHTVEWKRGELVIEKLTFVLDKIKECYADMQEEIQIIENNMKGSEKNILQEKSISFDRDAPILVGVLESAPKWISVLSAAKKICAIAEFMLSPVALVMEGKLTEQKKLSIINATYEDFVKQYHAAKVESELEITYGSHYRKLVERLFDEIIEKQTSNITKTFLRLKGECDCFENWKNELEHILKNLNDIQKRL